MAQKQQRYIFDPKEIRSMYEKMLMMLEDHKKIIIENDKEFKRIDTNNEIPPVNVKAELIETYQSLIYSTTSSLLNRQNAGLQLKERQHLEALVAWCKWAKMLLLEQ